MDWTSQRLLVAGLAFAGCVAIVGALVAWVPYGPVASLGVVAVLAVAVLVDGMLDDAKF
ncbi:MAG: hypothetical protein ABEJ40_03575 [Haloarculaceae archaeon]